MNIEKQEPEKTLGQLMAEDSFACSMGLPATRYVIIRGEEIKDRIISMGIDGVMNITNMAARGEIPEAEDINIVQCGCDVVLTGKNLISFIKRYNEKYENDPLWNTDNIEDVINPDNTYKIMCFDFG